MIRRVLTEKKRSRGAAWAAMTCLAIVALAAPVGAGELSDIDTSLKLMPADTALYASMYNAGEIVERVRGSNAWQAIKDMQAVQDFLDAYENAGQEDEPAEDEFGFGPPQNPMLQFKSFIENPQTQLALASLGDMLSEDVFVMAGGDSVDTLAMLQKLQRTMQQADLQAATDPEGRDDDEMRVAIMLDTLDKNLDAVQTPQILIGFKVSDTERAEQQVSALSGMLAIACMMQPQLGSALSQVEINESRFTTFTVTGEMVPWEEAPIDELEEIELEEGQAERVLEKAKAMKICISAGVMDEYLLIAIDESPDFLAKLGEGELLIDREELAPLADFTDETLLGISYVSEDFMKVANSAPDDIDMLVRLGQTALMMQATDENEAELAEISEELPAIGDLIKSLLPVPGAAVEVSMLTDDAIEGYSYNYGSIPTLVADKPLTVLSHVGGDPVVVIAGRADVSPDKYDELSHAAEVGLKAFDALVPPEMSKKDRKKYNKFKRGVLPILEELDGVNRDLLLPALADGQKALVLDNKWESKQFCPMMPEMDEPYPMFEPAIVWGVSDAEKLEQAGGKYLGLAQQVIDLLRSIDPEEFPEEVVIPEANVEEGDAGTMWVYDLPGELMAPESLRPNIGLNDTTLVVSLSTDHSQRILAETPVAVGDLDAETAEKPMAMAFALQWDALVETVRPWAQYGIEMGMQGENIDLDRYEYTPAEVADQADTLLNVLQCMKSMTVTVEEKDGVIVTHSRTAFEDLAE